MGILSSAPFAVEFSPASLARMASMINAAPVFAAYYSRAMSASVQQVATLAKQNTSSASVGGFMNPSGTLMRGIRGRVISPWLGEVGVGREIPYAHRRERGFSGMTDSLGRYYPYDPGIEYLGRALREAQPFIGTTFRTATVFAIRQIIL